MLEAAKKDAVLPDETQHSYANKFEVRVVHKCWLLTTREREREKERERERVGTGEAKRNRGLAALLGRSQSARRRWRSRRRSRRLPKLAWMPRRSRNAAPRISFFSLPGLSDGESAVSCLAVQVCVSKIKRHTIERQREREWRRSAQVVRLESVERCSFARTESRQVKGPKMTVVDEKKSNSILSGRTTKEHSRQVVLTVEEHVWTLGWHWSVVVRERGGVWSKTKGLSLSRKRRRGAKSLFREPAGRDDGCETATAEGCASGEMRTPAKESRRNPRAAERTLPSVAVDVAWLRSQLRRDKEGAVMPRTSPQDRLACDFAIDRRADSCRTPRRCEEVARVLRGLEQLGRWAHETARSVSRRASPQLASDLAKAPTRVFSPAAAALLAAKRDDAAHAAASTANTVPLEAPLAEVGAIVALHSESYEVAASALSSAARPPASLDRQESIQGTFRLEF